MGLGHLAGRFLPQPGQPDPDQQVAVGRGERPPGGIHGRTVVGRGHPRGERSGDGEVPGRVPGGGRGSALRRGRPPPHGEHGEDADGENRHRASPPSAGSAAAARGQQGNVGASVGPPGALLVDGSGAAVAKARQTFLERRRVGARGASRGE